MPRPLIIKVEDHKLQSNRKATGSINVELLKPSFYEKSTFEHDRWHSVAGKVDHDEPHTNADDAGPSGIVRNLISRYESSSNPAPNLTKYRSKSMIELPKTPIVSATMKKTQDDVLYNRNKYVDDDKSKRFDFRKVFMKFETRSSNETGRLSNKMRNYKISTHDSVELADIKRKAKELLDAFQHQNNANVWENQVLELLRLISDADTSANKDDEINVANEAVNVTRTTTANVNYQNKIQRAKSVDYGEFSNARKVRDIKNVFETKPSIVSKEKPLTRSVSTFAAYFGVKTDETNDNAFDRLGARPKLFHRFNSNDSESESSGTLEYTYNVEGERYEDAGNFQVEDGRLVTQPTEASANVQELKKRFEDQPDKYTPYNGHDTDISSESENIQVIDNRMLPPAKIVVLDNQEDDDADNGPAISKQEIEQLTKDIENYELQIAALSKENKEDSSYINEVLIRILLKLDEVKTYGDEIILRERRKAIQFVQNCIVKLKQKVHAVE